MFPSTITTSTLDSIVHVIQVALAPAFLLSALATLLNVFATRLARVADMVDTLTAEIGTADAEQAQRMVKRLDYLHNRSRMLDAAVVLGSLGSVMTAAAVLTLFVGALRDASAAAVLFGLFGAALLCTIGAITAFLAEILIASRGIRIEVAHGQDRAAMATDR